MWSRTAKEEKSYHTGRPPDLTGHAGLAWARRLRRLKWTIDVCAGMEAHEQRGPFWYMAAEDREVLEKVVWSRLV